MRRAYIASALVLAIVADPQIIVADEPTGDLDPTWGKGFFTGG